MALRHCGTDNSRLTSVRIASEGGDETITATKDDDAARVPTEQNCFHQRRCRVLSNRGSTMFGCRLLLLLTTWYLIASIAIALPLPDHVTSSPVSELVPILQSPVEEYAVGETSGDGDDATTPATPAVLNDSPGVAALPPPKASLGLKSECPPLDQLPRCVCHDSNSRVYLVCNKVDDVEKLHDVLINNHAQYSSLWLRISDSEFPVLTRRTFGGLRVEGLQINASNVTTVADTAFVDVHRLKSLALQDNLLTEIPVPALRRLLGLEMISLAGNRITSVATATFLGLPHLYYVSLSQNAIANLQRGAFGNGLRQIALSNNKINTLNGSVQHLANLEWLLLTGNELTTLRGQLVDLPSLTHLHVGDNRLTGLGDGALSQLHQLKALNVSANLLDRVDGSAFSGLTMLDKMDLSANLLTNLSDDSFVFLPKLTVLHLANNKLTSVGRALLSLISLQRLDLSGNLLESFDLETDLSETSLLRCLDLSQNRLTNLRGLLRGAAHSDKIDGAVVTSGDGHQYHPTFIRHLAKLEQLILSGNHLVSVAAPGGPVYHLPSLMYLLLDGNRMSVLDSRMLPSAPRLQLLNVSGNSLSRVSFDTFRHLTALTDLDLSVNQIHKLDAGTFATSARLQVLNVSGNRLDRLDGEMLEGLRSLVELDVSVNPLTDVDATAMHHVPALQRLSLQLCRLTSVREFLKPLHALQSLNLGDNLIEILDGQDVEALKNLVQLNMSSNNLMTVGIISQISLPKLTTLRLDNNRLAHVASDFRYLPQINDLDLRNNRLVRLTVDTFSHNPKLRTLYIKGNPWMCDSSLIELFLGLEANSTHIDDKPWCINNVGPMEGMLIN